LQRRDVASPANLLRRVTADNDRVRCQALAVALHERALGSHHLRGIVTGVQEEVEQIEMRTWPLVLRGLHRQSRIRRRVRKYGPRPRRAACVRNYDTDRELRAGLEPPLATAARQEREDQEQGSRAPRGGASKTMPADVTRALSRAHHSGTSAEASSACRSPTTSVARSSTRP